MKNALALLFFSVCVIGCRQSPSKASYHSLLTIIKASTDVIELTSNKGQSRLIISPYHQGKVIASTHQGLNGGYNGWINISKLEENTGIGGEERLWIGPLGGQFSFYYQQIEPISDDNWEVPEPIDTESYQILETGEDFVRMHKTMQLTNFAGTSFNLEIDRTIKLLNKKNIQEHLNILIDDNTNFVAFQTENSLTNKDTIAWKKETGLVGLWSAGMYQGTDDTVVIIPLKSEAKLKDIYQYMGTLDSTKLQLKNNILLYKGDGKYRSKIGVPPQLAPDIYGCYSKSKNRLTIVQYKKEKDSLYSNSFVSVQDEPYKGEAIPIYNNSADFFELESNAPLKVLQPNETTSHWHRVYHFSHDNVALNKISLKLLGVELKNCSLPEN